MKLIGRKKIKIRILFTLQQVRHIQNSGKLRLRFINRFVNSLANLGKEKQAEKIRDKLAAVRERRRIEEKLKSTKGLADDSDDDDSAAKWVERSKRIAEE